MGPAPPTGRSAAPRAGVRRRLAAATLATILAAALGAAGCGDDQASPIEARLKEETAEQAVLGFPALATKNTTRVGGETPTEDAAGVASAVFPGRSRAQRPELVTLVDAADWRGGVAAAALTAPPLRAPILLTEDGEVPDATGQALNSLDPRGAQEAGGAQVMRIGDAATPKGLRSTSITAGDQFGLAAAIDQFSSEAAGQPSENVVVVSGSDPRYAMPAAAWAAKSGDSVLFVSRDDLPAVTRRAIREHEQPGIYVLGPKSVVSDRVVRQLRSLGTVQRISGQTPVESAVAFARYTDGSFGWGIVDPGHGLVFANQGRVMDAPASAALSASGKYGPLLLLDSANRLPGAVERYLTDIQPGYRFDPVRGVYNHAWLMGDESAISTDLQARIDELAEIARAAAGSRLVSGFESPERLGPEHQVTPEDVRELTGAATPHFALQIRQRVLGLIDGLDAADPARVEGERAIARLERIAREGQASGPVADHEQPLPSLRLDRDRAG